MAQDERLNKFQTIHEEEKVRSNKKVKVGTSS